MSKRRRVSSEIAANNLRHLNASLDTGQRQVAAWRPDRPSIWARASAGSGKTTCLTALIGNLVAEGLDPFGLVVTTFTKRAGEELKDRLHLLVPHPAFDDLRVGTTHSLAYRALREHDETKWAFDQGMGGSNPSEKLLWQMVIGWGTIRGTDLKGLDIEDRVKDRGWTARDYASSVDFLRAHGIDIDHPDAYRFARNRGLPDLYIAWKLYEEAKASLRLWDFADVLATYWRHLQSGVIIDPAAVVLVDEAQDNNVVQLGIACELAGLALTVAHSIDPETTDIRLDVEVTPREDRAVGRMVFAGDTRQSIYTWRGAFPGLLQGSPTILGAEVIDLANNYRCAGDIVAMSNLIGRGKDWAEGAAAQATRDTAGVIRVMETADNVLDEAAEAVSEIKMAVETGQAQYSDFAILVRTNAHGAAFEGACIEAGVPVAVVGGTTFFGRADVRDWLSYCILSQYNALNALERVVNKPKRYLGKAFMRDLRSARKADPNGPFLDVISRVGRDQRNRGSRRGARELVTTLQRLRRADWSRVPGIAAAILEPKKDDGASADAGSDEDRKSLRALATKIAARFPDVEALVGFAAACDENIQTVGEQEAIPGGRVTVSTVHRAKGREWPRVYVAASEGTWPSSMSDSAARLDEEERLFYVAVTRARDQLVLTSHAQDLFMRKAGPSRYTALLEDFVAGDDTVTRIRPQDTRVTPETPELPDGTDVQAFTPLPAVLNSPDAPAWDAARRTAQAKNTADKRRSVAAADLGELLDHLGFRPIVIEGYDQRIWELEVRTGDWGYAAVHVLTGIPAGAEVTRESSAMSVQYSYVDTTTWGMHLLGMGRRVALTGTWRSTLLQIIQAIAVDVRTRPWCPECGAPLEEREDRECRIFWGCVRYHAGCTGALSASETA